MGTRTIEVSSADAETLEADINKHVAAITAAGETVVSVQLYAPLGGASTLPNGQPEGVCASITALGH
jgi:hypothetical protein